MTYDLIKRICEAEVQKGKSFPLFGKNSDGCNVVIDKCEDYYAIETFQKNGWIRVEIYHKDGTVEEEYTK